MGINPCEAPEICGTTAKKIELLMINHNMNSLKSEEQLPVKNLKSVEISSMENNSTVVNDQIIIYLHNKC